MRRTAAVILGAVAGVAAFLFLDGEVAETPTLASVAPSTTTALAPTTNTTTPPFVCQPIAPSDTLIVASPAGLLTELLTQLGCAEHLTIADSRDPYAVRTGHMVALARGGPLLLWPEHGDLPVAIRSASVTVVGLVPDEVAPAAERLAPRVTPAPTFAPVPGDLGMVVAAGDTSEMEAIALEVYARSLGWGFAVVGSADLREASEEVRNLASDTQGPIVVAGVAESDGWQLDVLRKGLEIPGGGQIMFPGRRIVALYGSPGFPALGVLGEQDPPAAVERAREVSEGYEADGTPILLGFEIISTIAAAGPTDDGDYSFEQPLDLLRPWIEEAGDAGLYVLLDLQPGRTDFLTQAKFYEEFLRLPHVGLALDPEWRLGPNQVHLRQIGTVDAAEVNQVSEWLAGLVREEALPQKLFLIHQFKLSMITNRETIEIRPELATVIQMDGQGPLGSKYGTWAALKSAGDNPGWWWGWKNFYDEDSPMAIPQQVLDLEPIPVLVTFQ